MPSLTRKPRRSRLEQLRLQWEKAESREDLVLALAKLQDEHLQLKEKVKVIESILLQQMLGMVRIGGVDHLLECQKRTERRSACTCGSQPRKKGT